MQHNFPTSHIEWYEKPMVWVHRGGRTGELEEDFISNSAIGMDWEITTSLDSAKEWNDLRDLWMKGHPDMSQASVSAFTRMLWDFLIGYKVGDLVIMPRRGTDFLAVGKITGSYKFSPDSRISGQAHLREVEWLNTEINKTEFPQELQIRFQSRKTIQRVASESAHVKILNVLKGEKQNSSVGIPKPDVQQSSNRIDEFEQDTELIGKQQIINFIENNYREHAFAGLVANVLQAQGFMVHVSPPGPDGGVDILAGVGPLGLDSPRLCVQVKSGKTPVDRPTLDQLIGAMQNFKAEQGLMVSWGGFNRNVKQVEPMQWFNVRLWDREAFVDALLRNFSKLDDDLKSTLPFKQVWGLSVDPRL
jgi:restriction system protein